MVFAIICLPFSRRRLLYIRPVVDDDDITINFTFIYTGIDASVGLVKSPPSQLVPSQPSRPPSQLNPPSKLVPNSPQHGGYGHGGHGHGRHGEHFSFWPDSQEMSRL